MDFSWWWQVNVPLPPLPSVPPLSFWGPPLLGGKKGVVVTSVGYRHMARGSGGKAEPQERREMAGALLCLVAWVAN